MVGRETPRAQKKKKTRKCPSTIVALIHHYFALSWGEILILLSSSSVKSTTGTTDPIQPLQVNRCRQLEATPGASKISASKLTSEIGRPPNARSTSFCKRLKVSRGQIDRSFEFRFARSTKKKKKSSVKHHHAHAQGVKESWEKAELGWNTMPLLDYKKRKHMQDCM